MTVRTPPWILDSNNMFGFCDRGTQTVGGTKFLELMKNSEQENVVLEVRIHQAECQAL